MTYLLSVGIINRDQASCSTERNSRRPLSDHHGREEK
jgi:hypothetical protein